MPTADPREALAEALGALGATLRHHRDLGTAELALGGAYLLSPEEALSAQERALQGCRKCKLCEGRTTIVFGSGHPRAEFVVIGEGPGADEDAQGLPFVGRAGQLLTKMLEAPKPSEAFRLLSDLGLLAVICPELEEAKGTPQDKAVAQNVFEHSLATLDATPAGDLVLRLAGLFHDIGKPATFADGHFHQHEFVGEAKARDILRRWRFDKETVTRVTHLVRNHMFWYQSEWTPSAVRRFIRKVGLENIPALFALRKADNIGSGARSPRMYALEALWERVQEEIRAASAFSLKDLAIDGNDVMAELGIPPGPRVGRILDELFERVTDDPKLNTRERLLELTRDIGGG